MAKAKRMQEKTKKIKEQKVNKHNEPKAHNETKSNSISIKVVVIILVILTIAAAIFYVSQNNVIEQIAVNIIANARNIENIKKEKDFENLKIKNIDIKYENGASFFKLELVNESDTDFEEGDIGIVFKNEDDTEYAKLKCHVKTIKSNEAYSISASTSRDLTEASNFYIVNE